MKKAVLTILGVIGFSLIFGAVGSLEYMDMTKQAYSVSEVIPQLVWGIFLMAPGLMEVFR